MRIHEIINEVDPIQIQQGPDISPELRRYKERGTTDTFIPGQREYGAQDIIGGGAPRVKNTVFKKDLTYGKSTDALSARQPDSEKSITHAQRKISKQELDDIKTLGYAVPPVTGTKFSKANRPEKWWSPADQQGQFGRNWAKGDATVRVPVEKLPKNRAVPSHDMQIQDPKTGAWKPLMQK